jgi:hypothetical protein
MLQADSTPPSTMPVRIARSVNCGERRSNGGGSRLCGGQPDSGPVRSSVAEPASGASRCCGGDGCCAKAQASGGCKTDSQACCTVRMVLSASRWRQRQCWSRIRLDFPRQHASALSVGDDCDSELFVTGVHLTAEQPRQTWFRRHRRLGHDNREKAGLTCGFEAPIVSAHAQMRNLHAIESPQTRDGLEVQRV